MMREKAVYTVFFLVFLLAVACGSDEENSAAGACVSDDDCSYGYECDTQSGDCVPEGTADTGDSADTGVSGDSGDSGDSADSGNTGNIIDPDAPCEAGEIGTCPYTGPPDTRNVGVCTPAQAICQPDGSWGPCKGEVLPSYDICNNGVDEDCDGTADNGPDDDGDGYGVCDGDCCDNTDECSNPAAVNPGAEEIPDGVDNNCDGNIDEGVSDCDGGLDPATSDPMHFAQAMELCTRADPGDDYGVLEAHLIFPDGTCCPDQQSFSILSSLGGITPVKGDSMVALSSGVAASPFPSSSNSHKDMGLSSNPPPDWYGANGNTFPSSPACGGAGSSGGLANDPVMLKLKVKAPPTAKGFKVNIFFLSIEFPQWVCSEYNDFFVALLDSGHTSNDPDKQNPPDKNLARDEHNNQVGVNLAKSGLFHVCDNNDYTSCEGAAELSGSGFEGHGGTGWLVTRGNIVPGEDITLRFAIWDSGDSIWDSMVLIDNFTWLAEESNPGTDDS